VKAPSLRLFLLADYGMAKGLMMTRLFAAAAISICSLFLISAPAQAQNDSDCFPWQEIKDGRCVPKGTSSAPTRSPTMSARCIGGANDAGGQCVCPANTHLDDASGSCLANVIPAVPQAPRPAVSIVCDGGQSSGGTCACPAGFKLKPAGDMAAGGACVRTDAENCLGGELTVAGACLCDRRVIMSGEEYALEYVNGKCVPQRCSIVALKEGTCVLATAKSGNAEPEEKAKPASPKVGSEEPEQRRHCGRGMIRTHSGCVQARRPLPSFYESGPAGLSGYYRSYRFPGISNSGPPN
jgi:hypothetical protein